MLFGHIGRTKNKLEELEDLARGIHLCVSKGIRKLEIEGDSQICTSSVLKWYVVN